jgi:hypothetical protein
LADAVQSKSVALAQAKPAAAQRYREGHPVLQRAIRQLEAVKDELQRPRLMP